MSNTQEENQDDKNQTSFTNSFKQQVMRAWQPVPTIKSTIILFTLLSVFFLAFGIILLSYSNQIKEYTVRYDETCKSKFRENYMINDPTNINIQPDQLCTVTLDIDEEMESPVFVYYELDNFYQNHRRYVKSRNINQLQGDDLSVSDLSACDPIETNEQANKQFSYTGEPLLPNAPAIPCGLIANSFFTDVFVMRKEGETQAVTINDKDIAWPSDKEHKFKNTPDSAGRAWIDMEKNERFIVWMRTAALPYFRKLWGRIETNLKPGKYEIQIENNFDVYKFSGKKHFVVSTANAFGGKNQFLAISYIVVGAICSVITIGFLIKLVAQKRIKPKNN